MIIPKRVQVRQQLHGRIKNLLIARNILLQNKARQRELIKSMVEIADSAYAQGYGDAQSDAISFLQYIP